MEVAGGSVVEPGGSVEVVVGSPVVVVVVVMTGSPVVVVVIGGGGRGSQSPETGFELTHAQMKSSLQNAGPDPLDMQSE